MKYITPILMMFFVSCNQVFALDGNISISDTAVGIDDMFIFQLETELRDDENLKSIDVQGLENFKIVGRSESQKIFSSSHIINGEVQKDMKRKYIITLQLQPKEEGMYTIGPAILSDDNTTFDTNTVELIVNKSQVASILNPKEKEKNNAPITPTPTPTPTYTVNNTITGTTDTMNKSDKFVKKQKNNTDMFLFIIPILMMFYIFFWTISKKKENTEDNEGDAQKESSVDYSTTDLQSEVPDINDSDFLDKAEEYILYYFIKKYHLNREENAFLEDIVKREELESEDKNILESIIHKRNLVKYSDRVVANTDMLELIQKLSLLKNNLGK